MRSNDVVIQKVDVLVLAVEAAWPAAVGENKEMARAVGRLERWAARAEPLQALLLRDRWPTRILACKEHDDRR